MSVAEPAVSSPLKWHGGKSYLASKIVALMPTHLHYVEPYAGGLSVLLAKDPEGVSEVVNDLNQDLYVFWLVMRDEQFFAAFRRLVEGSPFSQSEWATCNMNLRVPWTDKQSLVVRAYHFFVACRQSLAGRMKDFAPLSKTRVRRGMNEQASAWLSAVEGLPDVHERLKRVVILNCDALEVIRKQDGPQTMFYLDPPYLHETRASTGEYRHEMTTEDHERLLTELSGIKGKFILSGYPSDLYERFSNFAGWRFRDFDLPNNSAGGEKKRRMTERVWMNFEPEVK